MCALKQGDHLAQRGHLLSRTQVTKELGIAQQAHQLPRMLVHTVASIFGQRGRRKGKFAPASRGTALAAARAGRRRFLGSPRWSALAAAARAGAPTAPLASRRSSGPAPPLSAAAVARRSRIPRRMCPRPGEFVSGSLDIELLFVSAQHLARCKIWQATDVR